MSINQANNNNRSVTHLNEATLYRFGQLLLENFGLNFSENRQTEMEMAIIQSFASSTFTTPEEYLEFVKSKIDGGAEMERLANFATVNETHFFRDAAQFEALSTLVLPELIHRRQSMRTLRLWSAGCSTGEEPYSLAILLKELLPDIQDWSITILGTDINTNALDRARRGVYSSWSFREDQAKILREKYFKQVNNHWEIQPEIRRMVTFSRLNLAMPSYPSFDTNTNFIDLILCRNVLIYIDPSTAKDISYRMFESLQPGGWLAVAPSEGSPELFKRFQARSFTNAVLYQRLTQTAALRQDKIRNRVYTAPLRPLKDVIDPPEKSINLPRAHSASMDVPTRPVPTTEEQSMIEQAQELISFGQSTQALEILKQLSASRFCQDKVCALLGEIFANRGDWDQAQHWCTQAIRQNRLALEPYYTLALVLHHKGEMEQAIEAMRKVVYLDNTDILGHFELANLYFESGLFPKAAKSLDNALRLLENRSADDLVPRSGGTTVNRLRDAITRQQQHWNALMLDQSL